MRPPCKRRTFLPRTEAMKRAAWVSRLYPSAGSIAVLATVLFLCGSELYADDVPSLQKENGPCRHGLGPSVQGARSREACEATSELRQENKLPAYIYRWPKGNDGIETFAVLVGDAKTLKESESVLKQVRAISPRCLADMPDLSSARPGSCLSDHEPIASQR